MRINKTQKVLEHLQKFKTLTPLDALKLYGTMRLGAIIFNLRKDYNIVTEMIDVPTRFGTSRVAQYVLQGKIK